MASRDLEQILEQERERLARGIGSSKPIGLLNALGPIENATTTSNEAPLRMLNAGPKLAASAALPAAASINKGYTLPAQPPPAAEPPKETSVAGAIGNSALKLFTSGLGLMPLVSGLAGLFGGGDEPAPAPLVKYAMPRPIHIAATNSSSGGAMGFADYNQGGNLRSFGDPTGSGAPAASASQIVVNVQAMDSRSFLDHSQEIAQAVRDAMLNMHALNDVVNEL